MPKISPVNKDLKQILGQSYGGPSISFEDNKFILYKWGDAPVNTTIICEGETVKELIENYKRLIKYLNK